MVYNLKTPLTKEDCLKLKAGDMVKLTGTIYTARDAAHGRMIELLQKGEDLPIEIKNNIIYYAGPTPARPNTVIGSVGPTTSGRMDAYTPQLLDMGLCAMIGKGKRSEKVIDAMKRNNAVYFAATGGAGALMAKCIKSVEIICWEDLGSEAVRKMQVENMPLFVAIDAHGNDLYKIGPKEYLKTL